MQTSDLALRLVDDLVAEGTRHFTFKHAVERLGRSPTDTANVLHRAVGRGLLDRIRRGHYVVRDLGVLGTRAAAGDLATVVAAAFTGHPHRIAYRTALDEQDLISHPSRTIFVATRRRMRVADLSGHPLRTISEPDRALMVGAVAYGESWISDPERSLLDAASRPSLAGGLGVLVEAIMSAGDRIDPGRLRVHADDLGWEPALRRIGSLLEVLRPGASTGAIAPPESMTSDIDLDPGSGSPIVWRDSRWKVCWPVTAAEIRDSAGR